LLSPFRITRAAVIRRALALPVSLSVCALITALGYAALAPPAAAAIEQPSVGAATSPDNLPIDHAPPPTVAPTTPAAEDHAFPLPPIVARVNGNPITRETLDTQLERDYGQNALLGLILNQLLNEAAAKQGAVPSQARLDEAFNAQNTQASGQLPVLLEQHHMTKADFEQQILRPKLEMDAMTKQGITISDADIKTFFDAHKEQWATPKQVKLYRIKTATLAEGKAARAAIEKGMTWDAAVKKYSNDQSYYKDHEGYYGTVAITLLPPTVQTAVANLKAGEITEPIEMAKEGANAGFILWRVAEILPAKPASLDAHRQEIQTYLTGLKAKQPVDVVRELVKSAKITDLPDAFKGMFASLLNAQPTPPRPGIGGGPNIPPPPPPIGHAG